MLTNREWTAKVHRILERMASKFFFLSSVRTIFGLLQSDLSSTGCSLSPLSTERLSGTFGDSVSLLKREAKGVICKL